MLITNIRYLVNVREENILLRGESLSELPVLENAYLKLEQGKIAGYGPMHELSEAAMQVQVIDANQGSVLPCWCDSHTHLVYAGSRESELIDKIRGKSYAEIALQGGGIQNSARLLNETPEELLLEQAQERLDELMRLGTGAIEIKSGYGLSLEGELKMLRVIRQLKKQNSIPVKATFLGAHTIPQAYLGKRKAYIDMVIQEMLPAVAKDNLADYIDVFCETGFFTPAETEQICLAGAEYGLRPRIHANQLERSGGVQAGFRVQAVSVDHLEAMGEEEIGILSKFNAPIATLLPTSAFFLGMNYPPARQLIDHNAAIALASDHNPGSSPGGNMNFVLALACIQMKMLPSEAINAATINGAFAMEIQKEMGSISLGKSANLILTKKIPTIDYLPYSFSSNLIDRVMINARFL